MKGATNPKNFDRIVREVFAPIYPTIAEQIKERTKITQGKCLDAGCGTGALGRAMARISDLEILFFDQSDEMLSLARGYADDEKLGDRSTFLQGNIHAIGLEDESVELVISRGSSPFWEDWHKAYSEILRVLKSDGIAYIGGGFGNAELRDQIVKTMSENNPDWRNSFKDRIGPEREALPGILTTLNPTSFYIINDESGFWAVITK
ncbi:MAG: class I SAM-dependent methyltransferase [Sulfuricurvum sp.]|uniref:class I SAM-dependent methyltransferase n=1 Tax=Sulfuricurvum sp. TaxID=2025608 RepID=UPI002603A1E1|nr:class I SAM-dependent methyltransferase [Sulfuricurvum sp.]MDD2830244.1 class I SAM-dependent methyltransferase [Sulfuricurvum sp.]MDD4948798.1 class I SAM-dependent methyltransferase [Sulfuricurvum sp.]